MTTFSLMITFLRGQSLRVGNTLTTKTPAGNGRFCVRRGSRLRLKTFCKFMVSASSGSFRMKTRHSAKLAKHWQTTMKRLQVIITALLILSVTTTFGQNKGTCNCPQTQYAGTKADTTFHLSNGKIIVLCGYKNINGTPVTYSEFVLSVCGQDTIIGFWEALLTCRLQVHKDTLLVKRLEILPTGKHFKLQTLVWSTDKIYFEKQKPIKKLVVNRQIARYDKKEINKVLEIYRTTKPEIGGEKINIAFKLFVATISGNKTARKYFNHFTDKFDKIGAAPREEYDRLKRMLKQWDDEEL